MEDKIQQGMLESWRYEESVILGFPPFYTRLLSLAKGAFSSCAIEHLCGWLWNLSVK